MHCKILEENKTVLKTRQPYYRLYLFGHKAEGFKISSPPHPLSCSHHHLPPKHTPFQCVPPWVFVSAQLPQSLSLNWSSFLFLYFSVSAEISERYFSATLHFHFPFCELNRLRSMCWCQMHCLSNVSAINS